MEEKVSRVSAIQNLTAIMYLFMASHPRKLVCFHHYKHSDQLDLFFDADEEETAKEWLERAEALTLPGVQVMWKYLGIERNEPFFVVSVNCMLED